MNNAMFLVLFLLLCCQINPTFAIQAKVVKKTIYDSEDGTCQTPLVTDYFILDRCYHIFGKLASAYSFQFSVTESGNIRQTQTQGSEEHCTNSDTEVDYLTNFCVETVDGLDTYYEVDTAEVFTLTEYGNSDRNKTCDDAIQIDATLPVGVCLPEYAPQTVQEDSRRSNSLPRVNIADMMMMTMGDDDDDDDDSLNASIQFEIDDTGVTGHIFPSNRTHCKGPSVPRHHLFDTCYIDRTVFVRKYTNN